eukprot:CAMPEP_0197627244 /NCGR_PEP_ID=MMETSP1338-20131121/5912_1 /TAXON_ID=43686 ORGANISM="Pelagodinium beii, Strain RCC1491" /NCGR_SAMPLE_ID=MMETSP1338 /ASSEMBLY_ACC=CAM_ASM_000754 /LENGTH=31 /DNA_ID= /DNA_START= /DNA_END= /DNA_ORIENTATION=
MASRNLSVLLWRNSGAIDADCTPEAQLLLMA